MTVAPASRPRQGPRGTPTIEFTVSLDSAVNRNEDPAAEFLITSLTPGLYIRGEHQFPASTVLAGIPIGPNNAKSAGTPARAAAISKCYGRHGPDGYHFGRHLATERTTLLVDHLE